MGFFPKEHHPSPVKKAIVSLLMVGGYILAIFSLQPKLDHGGFLFTPRIDLMLFCVLLYMARVELMLYVYTQRRIRWLEVAIAGPLMALVIYAFPTAAMEADESVQWLDWLAAIVCIAGLVLGATAEHQRAQWKKFPGNEYKLFTGGLSHRVRHLNYTADVLTYLGIAMLTGFWQALIVPVGMTINFMVVLIPAKERHLRERYEEAFEQYRTHSKKLVPYVW